MISNNSLLNNLRESLRFKPIEFDGRLRFSDDLFNPHLIPGLHDSISNSGDGYSLLFQTHPIVLQIVPEIA